MQIWAPERGGLFCPAQTLLVRIEWEQLISNVSGAPAELPFVIKSRLSQKSPIPSGYWGNLIRKFVVLTTE